MEKEPKGKRRTVWLSTELDNRAETIRKELGLGHSAFYRFAIIELIKEFAQKKTTSKEKKRHE